MATTTIQCGEWVCTGPLDDDGATITGANCTKFKVEGDGKGTFYYGELHKNARHRRGVLTYQPNGAIYDGEWKDDMRSGICKVTWLDGQTFEGEYLDDRKLRGVIKVPDGAQWLQYYDHDGKMIVNKISDPEVIHQYLESIQQQGRKDSSATAGNHHPETLMQQHQELPRHGPKDEANNAHGSDTQYEYHQGKYHYQKQDKIANEIQMRDPNDVYPQDQAIQVVCSSGHESRDQFQADVEDPASTEAKKKMKAMMTQHK